MLGYLLKRVGVAVPVLLAVTFVSYLIISLTPGDPVDNMIDPTTESAMNPEQRRALREELGLNDPIPVRYLKWLGQLLRGNLGYSLINHGPVADRIIQSLKPTLNLGLTAIIISYLAAIPLGVVSALRQNTPYDYAASSLSLAGVSIPSFFLAMALIYVFSLRLGWLPVGGRETLGAEVSILDRVRHLILPVAVISTSIMGSVARQTRSAMLEVIRQDFVRTAHAKGLRPALVTYKHALRNALMPIVSLLGLQIPSILGGAIIVEQVFSYPGMGRLAVSAIAQRDYPLLMGINLLAAILVVLGGLMTDLLYSIVDPRIRYD